MKYLSCLLLLAAYLLPNYTSYAQEPLKVLATASMWADMTAQIGGELVEVDMIVPRGSDPHTYEPTPEDVVKVRQAELILKNGLTFEGWLDELINNAGTDAPIITLTEGIETITSQTYKNAPDPHAWMSARNGVMYAARIMEALVKLRPKHKDGIVYRFQQYQQQLRELHGKIVGMMLKVPEERRILITSHDAFQYFGRDYGLRLESVLGTSTDAQVQASDITRLSEVFKTSKVPAVFVETTVNPKQLQQLATDHGVKIGGKLFSDALGPADGPGGTYVGMIQHNASVIYEALSGHPPRSDDNSSSPSGSESSDTSSGDAVAGTPWMMYIFGGLIVLILVFILVRRLK